MPADTTTKTCFPDDALYTYLYYCSISIYYVHAESSSVLSACPLTISKDDNLLLVVYSFLDVGCFGPSFLHENNVAIMMRVNTFSALYF